MPDRLTWTPSDAAAALGRSARWLARHRAALEAAGFPAPLPMRLGYDPDAVRAFIERRRAAEANPDGAWHDALDQRAAALARLA